jgi:hypothetical protein
VRSKFRPRAVPIWRTLVFSIVLPLVTIQVLLHRGVAPTTTLALSTLFPLIEIALETLQNKRIGMIAVISLAGMAIGFGLTFLTGNPRFAVLKDSAFTFVIGSIFFGSLFTKYPMIYRFNNDFAGSDEAKRAANEALWQRPAVRAAFRLMTIVWGTGLLLEAVVRVAATLTLPLATATSVSPIIAAAALAGLALWNVLYVGALRRRSAPITEATAPQT